MSERVGALQEIITQYESEREVEATRLSEARLTRERLDLARQEVLEHGDNEAAQHLQEEMQNVDNDIAAHQSLIQRYDRLLGYFRASLNRAAPQ